LGSFPSQLRPDSVVQRWLNQPQGEGFAPMPEIDHPMPRPPAYYLVEMDLSSHGVCLDDTVDHELRASLAAGCQYLGLADTWPATGGPRDAVGGATGDPRGQHLRVVGRD
jgi:hypothetical protein